MEIDIQQVKELSKKMSNMLRKLHQPVDWILYVDIEEDPIPAALLSHFLPGSLVAPASPLVWRTGHAKMLEKAILFSTLASPALFSIQEAMHDLLHVRLPTAAFFKQVDDPNYWLDILPRGKVKLVL